MTTIVGIAGSLRRASFNAALLRAASERMPPESQLQIRSIRDVPLYDGDVENATGVPGSIIDINNAIAQAAGLLIATPEYNNSIPGVLKNAIDWMSRQPHVELLRKKPVAIIGATPGGMGTALAQAAWLPVVRTLGLRLYTGALLYVSRASKAFDEGGSLTDTELGERLQKYLAGFVAFANEHQ